MATKTPKQTATPKPAAKKAPPKVDGNGRAKKEGLRKAQIRILQLLAKAKGPLSVNLIAEKASVDRAWVPDALFGRIGDADGKVITKPTAAGIIQEAKQGYPSLLGLGFVKARTVDVEGKTERLWEITAAGRKGLEKALKSE